MKLQLPSYSLKRERSRPLKLAYMVASAIVLLSMARIVTLDRTRPQGFDEPAHVAAGMEWIQFHRYRLDPLHPPLSRIVMAFPLFASGARLSAADVDASRNFWAAGNAVLNRGNYLCNLSMARYGALPFLAGLLIVVFIWTQRRFGDFVALVAVTMLSTLPIILAFSSLAYTDLPAACMQVLGLFAFENWLQRPTWKNGTFVGVAFGLAVLTKFTSLLFIPAGAIAIVTCRWLVTRRSPAENDSSPERRKQCVFITLLVAIIVWAGYGFSFGHIDEALHLSPANVPSFQHFPVPIGAVARRAVLSDWVVPAPAFFAGLADAWVLNRSAPDAYLFGKQKSGGWWYFFFAEIFFKTPLSFLLLANAGFIPLVARFKKGDWSSALPAAGAIAILLLTTFVTTNYGLRHVLVVFPLLAITAGCGANWLWTALAPNWRVLGGIAAAALITWQCAAVLAPDPIAYFNEFAGHDPSYIIVTGCDFDCGQDLLALSAELHRRKADHVALAVWSSADLSRLGLPPFEILQPFQSTSGWIAVSVRAVREGSVLHESYPAGAFNWLDRFRPVAQVGKTIRLYHIGLAQGDNGAGLSTRPQS